MSSSVKDSQKCPIEFVKEEGRAAGLAPIHRAGVHRPSNQLPRLQEPIIHTGTYSPAPILVVADEAAGRQAVLHVKGLSLCNT